MAQERAADTEAAGFDGIGFTHHPAPSHKWLQAGGHDALDPFVALGVLRSPRTCRSGSAATAP